MINLNFFRSHYPTPVEGIAEALIGLTFYLSLFHGLINFLHYKSLPGSGNWRLKTYDILEISNKFVSSTFAIITCSLAIKVYGECGDDVIYGRHNLIRHYMCFAVFYFIYDTYAMFVVYNESRALKRSKREIEKVNGETPDSRGDKSVELISEDISKTVVQFIQARPLMIAHHMVLPLILFPIFMAFQTGLGDCLLAVGFLMEASTPFVSARKILSVVGMKNSFLYVLNGAVMTLLFFCCRVLIFPIIYYLFARQMDVSCVETVIHHVPWFCTVSTVLIWLPQVYWWFLMVKGCFKVIGNFKPEEKKKE